ncbi:MAG TPA: hypothetical protein VGD40_04685 [Chryseosolibacter sp.]
MARTPGVELVLVVWSGRTALLVMDRWSDLVKKVRLSELLGSIEFILVAGRMVVMTQTPS